MENNIGNGYSTCPDTTQSQRFLGESWSYLACISPQQSSLQCQHCNTIRSRVAAGPFNAFPTLPVAGPGQAFPPGTVVGPWRTIQSDYDIFRQRPAGPVRHEYNNFGANPYIKK